MIKWSLKCSYNTGEHIFNITVPCRSLCINIKQSILIVVNESDNSLGQTTTTLMQKLIKTSTQNDKITSLWNSLNWCSFWIQCKIDQTYFYFKKWSNYFCYSCQCLPCQPWYKVRRQMWQSLSTTRSRMGSEPRATFSSSFPSSLNLPRSPSCQWLKKWPKEDTR